MLNLPVISLPPYQAMNPLEWLSDIFNLIYPQVCAACGNKLQRQEDIICILCEHHLPQTDYHLKSDSPLDKLFWGRIRLSNVAAMYFYQKGERVQQLIYQFKYNGWKEVGVKVGQVYGRILAQTEAYKTVDLIVPVPLHPNKKRKRGYNQSDFFARGLSESMQIPWSDNVVQRIAHTPSQTKKTRYERWKNVEDIFAVIQPGLIEGKHILLVDDVITTGSTIEACATAMLNIKGTQVSAVSIAHAQ